MMRRISNQSDLRKTAILLAVLLAVVGGCRKDAPVEEPMPRDTGSEFKDAESTAPPPSDSGSTYGGAGLETRDVGLAPIYFSLDSTVIRSEFKDNLEAGAAALTASGGTIVIEGHCDERGSEEYNFALGERRAGSVRKYLYNLGVPMAQMTVVSYGEVQPAVSGRGESAWGLNRRAEFKVR